MNPLVAQYTPFFLAVTAVGLGVIYSNARIGEIKDLIRSELARVEGTIRADIARLDKRIDHIEQRFERERIVRP